MNIDYSRLEAGNYSIDDAGRMIKHADIGKELVVQGKAAEFNIPFVCGDEVWILRDGCFDKFPRLKRRRETFSEPRIRTLLGFAE